LFVALAPVAYVSHQRSLLLAALADFDAAAILALFGAASGVVFSAFLCAVSRRATLCACVCVCVCVWGEGVSQSVIV
jgi:hypothetical protein